ncbi:MAG: hypothetical protein ABIP93_20930 [Gemmatimonadaceae bacterium]
MRTSLFAALGMALATAGAIPAAAQSDRSTVPLYDNLGEHHYGVTTHEPRAQRYFDQGLRLYYAFNHAEAIRAFDEAARLDPRCAMCFWGSALSYGPNINVPMDSASGVAAHVAIEKAVAAASFVSPRERSLIDALAKRYVATPAADRSALDSAYAFAMRNVVARFPSDADARTLYAESLMDLSPWNYWEKDGSPRPHTRELVSQLDKVIAANKLHPGALHFFIHAVEAVDPKRAVPIAERLANLMPGAGHLVHMPGHIYVRVGRYVDAIKANEHAVHADETFIGDQKPSMGPYVGAYYPHNYAFLAFVGSLIGRSQQSLSASEKLVTLAPPELQRVPAMSFAQHHATRHLQMKIRFAKWDDILEAPAPAEDLVHARAMWHYARGRALAARGNVRDAEAELVQVRAAAARPSAAEFRLDFNTSAAVLGIAAEALDGHIAASQKDYPRAVRHLREAARLEDALVYGEPPEWTVPVRQELGVVQLDAGLAADAERSFREDLARFPENGWSLHGLARALKARGRMSEAAGVMERFRRVWSGSDIQLAAVGGVAHPRVTFSQR